MKPSYIVGIALCVLGALAFVYQGFSYNQRDKVVDVGPLEVFSEKTKWVSWPPMLGAVGLAAGVGLILLSMRKQA